MTWRQAIGFLIVYIAGGIAATMSHCGKPSPLMCLPGTIGVLAYAIILNWRRS